MNTRVTKVTALLGLVLMFSLAATDPLDEYLRYEEFVEAVKSGQVVSVELDEFSQIDGVYTVGGAEQAFHTYHADPRDDPLLLGLLREKNVNIKLADERERGLYSNVFSGGFAFVGCLTILVPILTLLCVLYINRKVSLVLDLVSANEAKEKD
jgi:ATP-dependent Zn protease